MQLVFNSSFFFETDCPIEAQELRVPYDFTQRWGREEIDSCLLKGISPKWNLNCRVQDSNFR